MQNKKFSLIIFLSFLKYIIISTIWLTIRIRLINNRFLLRKIKVSIIENKIEYANDKKINKFVIKQQDNLQSCCLIIIFIQNIKLNVKTAVQKYLTIHLSSPKHFTSIFSSETTTLVLVIFILHHVFPRGWNYVVCAGHLLSFSGVVVPEGAPAGQGVEIPGSAQPRWPLSTPLEFPGLFTGCLHSWYSGTKYCEYSILP